MTAAFHYVCPICGVGGRACGDSHMTRPPVSSELIKGVSVMAEGQPLELKEYEYYVGHTPVTAMLSEAQADRLGAKPVGEAEDPAVGEVPNNEASRHATQTREAEDSGVNATHADGTDTGSAAEKTRSARNKRAS